MSRLLVHVEGITEETFVNELLCDYLCERGYISVSARLVGNARLRSHRGGIRGWPSVRRDIINHLREDPSCIATTMVDYYGLPQTGDEAWPGRQEASVKPFTQKAATIQDTILHDICSELGEEAGTKRFIPYIMMHEFEGLLFSNCSSFADGIGHPELTQDFQDIRDQFNSPEEINDSPITAPSKRIVQLLPNYDKPFQGTLAVIEIGLDNIRNECPQFTLWLQRLEEAVKS